jgi:hypothetical protein
MLTRNDHRGIAGISVGMAIVFAGLATMIFGNVAIGLAATVVGLVTFAGFALSKAD